MTDQQMIDYFRQYKLDAMRLVQQAVTATGDPDPDIGKFGAMYDPWEADVDYEQGKMLTHEGEPLYVKQAHTSQATWQPFSPGTEALYGARPSPDPEDGTYPYVYNMAASAGMRVWGTDGVLYQCIQAIPDMLYPPEQIPAHFEAV